MIQRTLSLFMLTVTAFFVIVSPVAAVATQPPKPKRLRPQEPVRMMERICANVENRIEARIHAYETRKEGQIVRYRNVIQRLENAASRLEKKGLDVTKLKSYTATLGEKVAKSEQDYAVFIAKLREARGLACGESEGAFVAQLQEARTLLQTFRKDVEDLSAYYKTVIRPELETLKNHLEKNQEK